MLKRIPVYSSPTPQKIQPMGLAGRREAISAPTVGYASDSTPVSTVSQGSNLSWGGSGISPPVRNSSKRAIAMSATHPAHNDQANQAAVRRLIRPIPRSCFLASFITTITLPHYPLQSITTTVHGIVLRSEGTSFRERLLLGTSVNTARL